MTAVNIGPFQDIVNVGWGRLWVALQFRTAWVGGSSGPAVPITVQIPKLGLSYDIFGSVDTDLAKNAVSHYHLETSARDPDYTSTTTTYDYTVTFSRPPDSGNGTGTITVVSDGTSSFWTSNGGASGPGGIDAAQTYYLTHGWDTFSATETGSTSHTSSGPMIFTDTDHGILFFNLTLLKVAILAIDPHATLMEIKFATGVGPTTVEGATSSISYAWTSIIGSFKNTSAPKSFPVDGQDLPNGWPTPVSTRTDTGSNDSETNITLDYFVNLTTLEVTRA